MKAFTDPNIISNLFLKVIKRRIKKKCQICSSLVQVLLFVIKNFSFFFLRVIDGEKKLSKFPIERASTRHCHY